jgi:hypothetical protein
MQINRDLKYSCAYAARALRKHPDVVSVGIGYRYRGGVKTNELCVVVGVRKKYPPEYFAADENRARLIKKSYIGTDTDIQEYGDIWISSRYTGLPTQALTNRVRPIPPGYSCGHKKITAGTLGCWVGKTSDPSDAWYILSNNHVLANSNDANVGDPTLQPGPADGGSTPRDDVGTLYEYVKINFEGENGGKKDGKKGSSFAWKLWKYPANFVAKLVGCPFRLVVTEPHVVNQPDPNLVDAALTKVVDPSLVFTEIPFGVGVLQGIRDLNLGEEVVKVGRTTEFTSGYVDVVGASVTVNYGGGKQAVFDDQVIIKAHTGSFSAGGDSGSVIVTEDNYLGSLLFAGSASVTICNKISSVVSLLGIRLK